MPENQWWEWITSNVPNPARRILNSSTNSSCSPLATGRGGPAVRNRRMTPAASGMLSGWSGDDRRVRISTVCPAAAIASA